MQNNETPNGDSITLLINRILPKADGGRMERLEPKELLENWNKNFLIDILGKSNRGQLRKNKIDPDELVITSEQDDPECNELFDGVHEDKNEELDKISIKACKEEMEDTSSGRNCGELLDSSEFVRKLEEFDEKFGGIISKSFDENKNVKLENPSSSNRYSDSDEYPIECERDSDPEEEEYVGQGKTPEESEARRKSVKINKSISGYLSPLHDEKIEKPIEYICHTNGALEILIGGYSIETFHPTENPTIEMTERDYRLLRGDSFFREYVLAKDYAVRAATAWEMILEDIIRNDAEAFFMNVKDNHEILHVFHKLEEGSIPCIRKELAGLGSLLMDAIEKCHEFGSEGLLKFDMIWELAHCLRLLSRYGSIQIDERYADSVYRLIHLLYITLLANAGNNNRGKALLANDDTMAAFCYSKIMDNRDSEEMDPIIRYDTAFNASLPRNTRRCYCNAWRCAITIIKNLVSADPRVFWNCANVIQMECFRSESNITSRIFSLIMMYGMIFSFYKARGLHCAVKNLISNFCLVLSCQDEETSPVSSWVVYQLFKLLYPTFSQVEGESAMRSLVSLFGYKENFVTCQNVLKTISLLFTKVPVWVQPYVETIVCYIIETCDVQGTGSLFFPNAMSILYKIGANLTNKVDLVSGHNWEVHREYLESNDLQISCITLEQSLKYYCFNMKSVCYNIVLEPVETLCAIFKWLYSKIREPSDFGYVIGETSVEFSDIIKLTSVWPFIQRLKDIESPSVSNGVHRFIGWVLKTLYFIARRHEGVLTEETSLTLAKYCIFFIESCADNGTVSSITAFKLLGTILKSRVSNEATMLIISAFQKVLERWIEVIPQVHLLKLFNNIIKYSPHHSEMIEKIILDKEFSRLSSGYIDPVCHSHRQVYLTLAAIYYSSETGKKGIGIDELFIKPLIKESSEVCTNAIIREKFIRSHSFDNGMINCEGSNKIQASSHCLHRMVESFIIHLGWILGILQGRNYLMARIVYERIIKRVLGKLSFGGLRGLFYSKYYECLANIYVHEPHCQTEHGSMLCGYPRRKNVNPRRDEICIIPQHEILDKMYIVGVLSGMYPGSFCKLRSEIYEQYPEYMRCYIKLHGGVAPEQIMALGLIKNAPVDFDHNDARLNNVLRDSLTVFLVNNSKRAEVQILQILEKYNAKYPELLNLSNIGVVTAVVEIGLHVLAADYIISELDVNVKESIRNFVLELVRKYGDEVRKVLMAEVHTVSLMRLQGLTDTIADSN